MPEPLSSQQQQQTLNNNNNNNKEQHWYITHKLPRSKGGGTQGIFGPNDGQPAVNPTNNNNSNNTVSSRMTLLLKFGR
jgi:hypothetical protein